MSRPLPSPATGIPRCSNHHAYVPCPLPRRIGAGACVDCFPIPRPSPNSGRVGIRIVLFEACAGFTRVTPPTLAQPPRRPLSRGFDGTSYPATPPVSYQLNRQLAGWNPPTGVSRLRGAPEIADVGSAAHERTPRLNLYAIEVSSLRRVGLFPSPPQIRSFPLC